MKRCLACRKTINEEHSYEYHAKCSKIFFGTSNPPQLNHSLSDIDKIAEETINRRISVTGVQPKLSLDIHNQDGKNRLTIVNMWGQFVVSTALAIPEDNEEYALTINGKKSNFNKDDFNKLSAHLRINDKTLSSIYNKFSSWKKIAMTSIDDSFLSIDDASKLKTIINTRAERLGI